MLSPWAVHTAASCGSGVRAPAGGGNEMPAAARCSARVLDAASSDTLAAQPSTGSGSGASRPVTPDAVDSLAGCSARALSLSPRAVQRASRPATPQPESSAATSQPEGHAAAPQQSAAAGDALAEQVQLLGRANSFLRCVAGSPLLKSALLALEAAGAHPPVLAGSAAPAGLEWTLAQMLALSRRAGDNTGVCACGKRAGQWSVAGPPTQRVCVAADPSTARRSPAPPRPPAASEAALLAGLWLLESANDGNCSPATAVLGRYTRLLYLFSPEVGSRRCRL